MIKLKLIEPLKWGISKFTMETKKLIEALGFTPKEKTSNTYHKKYSECNNYEIEVDFDKKKIDFGKIIRSENGTNQNFSPAENWVVLECVDRLLKKGYKPKNISLEKTWKTGHGTSGRLDILVTQKNSTYLMIECKTWGKEFEKEFKNLEKNGGQLFTYFQQDNTAEVLMLYASKFDGQRIQYRNEIVKIEEHYRQAGNVEDVFDRWNKVSNSSGVFEDLVKPYLFENKKLTKKDLKPLTEEDSQKIFYQFLSILRKHSVSDKSNAFNKIFNLFLAKIFDEKKKDTLELEFQWKEHKDNSVEFQIRLINLYKAGMYDFLKKELAGISDDMFNYSDQRDLEKKKKNILIFNKTFDIKDVFDNESFDDNQIVLKEVVQLLQNFKIRYPRKQQHLSDFFERLLTTGLKQEVGQFFTPPPITRFIIRSLPISKYIREHLNEPIPKLPAVIDYSVGSGHFLTEVMEEYQRVIENDIDISEFGTDEAEHLVNSWKENKYAWASKYIYGIEKDYRLVKVAKVGCYFYGDGLAQVIHGDGLDNFKSSKSYRGLLKENAKNPQFSFIVSNPPYSISSFKGDIKNINAKKDFKLYDRLTDRSSEIECLFVERTKQLLKTDGIASIILPSSILSNTGIYTESREIILKHFNVIAITELGSATFMATGTNTVILFLKRRKDKILSKIEEALDEFFDNLQDLTINGIEKPISKYISHVWKDIKFSDYKTLLQKLPNKGIEEHEIYKTYQNNNLKWIKILELEKEKLFYFILTYNQKLVLVKTGQKKEEKQFLGYEFSNRRGSEGIHPIQRGKNIDDCTQLYDPTIFDNPEKASTYIYKAFTENRFDLDISEKLQKNVSYQNLVDMLTFDRVNFEKRISLSSKKKIKIESKWELVKIGDLIEILDNRRIPISQNERKKGKYPYYGATGIIDYIDKYIFDETLILIGEDGAKWGKNENSAFMVSKKYWVNNHAHVLKPNRKKLLDKYLIEILNSLDLSEYITGMNVPKLNQVNLREIKIPLPLKKVQEKIVSEIEVLEQKENQNFKNIEVLKEDISNIMIENKWEFVKIGDLIEILDNRRIPISQNERRKGKYPYYGATGIIDYIDKYIFDETLILIGEDGAKWGKNENSAFIVSKKYWVNNHAHVLKPNRKKLLDKYLIEILNSLDLSEYITGMNVPKLNQVNLREIKIPLPPKKVQEKIVSQVEGIENKIDKLQKELAEIPQQKEEILKKYL